MLDTAGKHWQRCEPENQYMPHVSDEIIEMLIFRHLDDHSVCSLCERPRALTSLTRSVSEGEQRWTFPWFTTLMHGGIGLQ